MVSEMTPQNPTAEQILTDEWILQADRAKAMTGMDAIWFPDAGETLAALRAHNLLSEGAPSEEQIERAARAYDPEAWAARDKYAADGTGTQVELDLMVEYSLGKARAALTAAGVAPQEPSDAWADRQLAAEVAAKSGKPAPPTAREKLIAAADVFLALDERERVLNGVRMVPVELIRRMRDALAAPLDPVKVAEWFGSDEPRKSRDETYGQYDRRRARALCEAAKRGELSQ